MNSLQRAYWIFRAVGWDNVPRRALHMLRRRFGGHERRLPSGELPPNDLRRRFVEEYDDESANWWRNRAKLFFVNPDRARSVSQSMTHVVDDDTWQQHVTCEVEDLREGRLLLFGHHRVDGGRPIQFNRDHLHLVDWPTDRHWSRYDQFDPSLDDLKCVWEPSRFSFAYALAREYARRDTPEAAELFWQVFEEWDRQNPYGSTPQWACGQEGSFRAMAWLFAACAMLDAPATTPERLHRLTQLIWYTGRHVDFNINYARSQKNNHALSEAAVLWAIGLLFPEFRDAGKWREKGATILAREIDRQIYADGSYVQHSFNYHRLMMDDLMWALAIDQVNDRRLSPNIRRGLERAYRWLLPFVDPQSGRVPNYGANDGARILPLSCSDYLDYRPVLQTAARLLDYELPFDAGPWDEKASWLLGPDSRDRKSGPPASSLDSSCSSNAGGYYQIRGSHTWAVVRCHSYRDRPSQADMVHVDLWRGRENILRDAGSFAYYAPPPWQHYFQSTAAHNTIEIDGLDQMTKGPRFMWFQWTRSRLFRFETSADGRLSFFDGQHSGYARLPRRVIHRRAMLRIDDTYMVIDDCTGAGTHDVRLRWRLHPAPWQSSDGAWRAETPGGAIAVRITSSALLTQHCAEGEAGDQPEGWESLYYQEKQPVPTLIAHCRSALPLRIVSFIHLSASEPPFQLTADTVGATAPLSIKLTASGIDAGRIAEITGGRVRAE